MTALKMTREEAEAFFKEEHKRRRNIYTRYQDGKELAFDELLYLMENAITVLREHFFHLKIDFHKAGIDGKFIKAVAMAETHASIMQDLHAQMEDAWYVANPDAEPSLRLK